MAGLIQAAESGTTAQVLTNQKGGRQWEGWPNCTVRNGNKSYQQTEPA